MRGQEQESSSIDDLNRGGQVLMLFYANAASDTDSFILKRVIVCFCNYDRLFYLQDYRSK